MELLPFFQSETGLSNPFESLFKKNITLKFVCNYVNDLLAYDTNFMIG